MTTETTQPKETRFISKAREQLKALSLEVKDLVEEREFENINEAILETFYRTQTHREFKTYKQWQKDGMQVKLGSKAYLLWARPKQVKNKEAEKEAKKPEQSEGEEDKYKFFPICYLFSNAQVEPIQEEVTA